MKSNRTTLRIQTEATRELRRAVRDFPDVEIVDSAPEELTLRGKRDDIQAVKRALRTRELSAIAYGQESLASADATARAQIEQAT